MSYDLKLDVKKEYDVKIDVEAEFSTTIDVKVTKDVDVKLDLSDMKGNAAILVYEVDAIGEDSFTEVTYSIIVTDSASLQTGEASAFVG